MKKILIILFAALAAFSFKVDARADDHADLAEMNIEYNADLKEASQNPFLNKRIIVESESANDHNAEAVVHMGNLTFLQYASEEEAKEAYNRFSKDYKTTPDYVIRSKKKACVRLSSLRNHKKHLSYGIEMMGLDLLQKKAEKESEYFSDVLVAVIDSGVEDRENNIRLEELGTNTIDETSYLEDEFCHGTHVAGIICDGTSDNIKIMSVKALDSSGNGTVSSLVNAVFYAVENGADVINISIEGNYVYEFLYNAFEEAINANAIVLTSAGNDGRSVYDSYPACSSQTITVGAVDENKEIEPYSNTGNAIDFVAPGKAIESLSSKGGTVNMTGTSMAVPHISAAVAMLKSINKDITKEDAISLLSEYAEDLGEAGKDPVYGNGFVDFGSKAVHQWITMPYYNYSKVYGSKPFDLNAKAETDLTYKSSDNSVVSVSHDGRVTINGVGKATIIVQAERTMEYCETAAKVTITVRPKPTRLVRLDPLKRGFKAKWAKQAARTSGYQLQYAANKSFTSKAKTITIKSNKVISRKVTGLKGKKRYYVRVRTYKTVGTKKYLSSWSNAKIVKTK